MLVFNAFAIVVGIIVALLVWPLNHFAPEFMDGTYGNIVIASIALVVSGIGEVAGVKARVFWLPVWLWSIGILGYLLYGEWGWYGPAGAGVVGVAGVGAMLYFARKAEQEEWAAAPRELEMARALVDNPESREQCFTHLNAAFFSPAFMSESAEIWTHQRGVLAVAQQLLEGQTQIGKEHLIGMLDRAYAAKLADESAEDPEHELVMAVESLIEHQGHPPEDEDED